MRNAKAKKIVAAATTLRRRSSMIGMSPAWKRHCIRQRKVAASNNIAATTIVPKVVESNFSKAVFQIKSFTIGSFAGLLGSLAGMGGGFVMIPMMTSSAARTSVLSKGNNVWWKGGLGLSQHQAHGTSLFAVGTTGLAGALGYGITFGDDGDETSSSENDIAGANSMGTSQQQTLTTDDTQNNQPQKGVVKLDTALALATTAMITARFGAIVSSKLSERMLQRALGAFMIGVAPLVPAKAFLNRSATDILEPIDGDVAKSQLERLLPASVIGIFSGFLSGMFGVGGGAIVVPALVLSTDMSHHSALGTSLCAMVLPAMVGTYTHSTRGNVNWRVAPMLALGSAAAAFVGGREVGMNLDEGVLRTGFSCLMFVLGVRTWRKGSR
jgi:hypothetical protein